MKQLDIVALGECLIDFVAVKGKDPGKILLEGNAGGAPANVLAAAAKLGRSTGFIGRVGTDAFGSFLKARIAETGVDISPMVQGNEPTTLAMVTLDDTGNRSFSFYRNQTADVMLEEFEVDMEKVASCRIFHFGSISMTADPAHTATLAAAAKARQAGVLISFDPNYRPLLWQDKAQATQAMEEGIKLADFVKVSDEEAEMLSGESDPEKAALALQTKYHTRFLAVTLGPKGCIGISEKARVVLPTYSITAVDTTGAGDAFWGAALHRLLAQADPAQPLDEKQMTSLLHYANAAGSLATTKHGAIPALATDKEIMQLVRNGKPLE